MPLDSLEFRTSLQKLLIALIVILVPVTIFGFYVALQGDNHIRQANGEAFRSLTLTAAEFTSDYIADCVEDVSAIANTPDIIRSVATANRQYEHLSDDAILAKVSGIDEHWDSAETDAISAKILTSDPARYLRRLRELNPTLLKITVADLAGSTVAATDRPAHYSQTDRDLWRALSSGGMGSIHVSDLRYDDQNRLYYLSLAYPILQEGTGRFIGAVTATVNLSPMFAQLNRHQIGRTGRLFLVRDDGMVIESPGGVSPLMRIKSEEYAAIRDALGTLRGRQAGYVFATLSNRQSYLIGFADVGLKDAYPNLPWIVLASQETREVTGPVRNMVGFALALVILAFLILSLLAAYVFLHTKQEIDDIETPEDKEKYALV
ncbi:MAG TPA: cache domain-containing protein [Candidatus Sulfotelmatobacter sp.]|nr:cache domain-containing protein [Candidatus Sulfotelmatobacter sp.]